MAASERAQEIARAITAYEEAEAAVDWAKRKRLSEILKTLHDAVGEHRRQALVKAASGCAPVRGP